MRFDQSQTFTTGFLIAPESLDSDNTPAAFDIGKALSATIHISVGVGGITFSTTNKIEFVLTHSDDNDSYTAVTADDVRGVSSVGEGGIVHALVAAHATPTNTAIGYVGRKRFIKLLADFSGTHGDPTPISALAVRGNLERISPA
jgi:hypothetical protein